MFVRGARSFVFASPKSHMKAFGNFLIMSKLQHQLSEPTHRPFPSLLVTFVLLDATLQGTNMGPIAANFDLKARHEMAREQPLNISILSPISKAPSAFLSMTCNSPDEVPIWLSSPGRLIDSCFRCFGHCETVAAEVEVAWCCRSRGESKIYETLAQDIIMPPPSLLIPCFQLHAPPCVPLPVACEPPLPVRSSNFPYRGFRYSLSRSAFQRE